MQIPVNALLRWQLQCLYTSLTMWKQMYDAFAGTAGQAAEPRTGGLPVPTKGGCLGPADLKG